MSYTEGDFEKAGYAKCIMEMGDHIITVATPMETNSIYKIHSTVKVYFPPGFGLTFWDAGGKWNPDHYIPATKEEYDKYQLMEVLR